MRHQKGQTTEKLAAYGHSGGSLLRVKRVLGEVEAIGNWSLVGYYAAAGVRPISASALSQAMGSVLELFERKKILGVSKSERRRVSGCQIE